MAGEKNRKLFLMEFINYCNMFLVTQYDKDLIKERDRAISKLKKLEK